MKVFRLSKAAFALDLTGEGARLYPGRWNTLGTRMVYTSASRALTVLEMLVHSPLTLPAENLIILSLDLPESATIEHVTELPAGWNMYEKQRSTQNIGEKFVRKNQALVLRVPSVIVPEEYNYLINPLHPDATMLRVAATTPFAIDPRLFVKTAPTAS